MPDKPVPIVENPEHITVRVVNGHSIHAPVGGLIEMVLITTSVRDFDRQVTHEVAARVRFDLDEAKRLRDSLSQQIAALMVPNDIKPN